MSFAAAVRETKTALSADPAQAKARFEAHHELVGPTEVTVKVGSGHSFTVDEPPALGGVNAGANPVEYALASLGSCQAITYRVWAAQLGIRLDTVNVEIDGDIDLRGFFGIDDKVRPGFGTVRIKVNLGGPEPAARYEELAAAVDAHCPVLDLFRNPVPVERVLASAA
jgi:putative redox protein